MLAVFFPLLEGFRSVPINTGLPWIAHLSAGIQLGQVIDYTRIGIEFFRRHLSALYPLQP